MSRTPTSPITRGLTRLGACAMLAGALAACNTSRGAQLRTQGDVAYTALDGSPRRVPLVSLPDAGPAALIEETRLPGGLRQRIAFGRDGSSRADLTLGIAGSLGGLALAKPTRRGIEAELAALQGGPYRVRTQPTHNAYGPVGVALGRSCAFAWQWIEDLHGIDLRGAADAPGRVSASLRVHHCGRGSTDALVSDLTRLRLSAEAPPRVARVRRLPRPARAVAAAPAPAAPAVVEPIAQPAPAPAARPMVTVNGSRTLVSVPQDRGVAPPADPAGLPRAAIPRPGAAGAEALDQPRYLSDGSLARVPASAAAVPPARREQLSTDLPAQAYRGPTPPPFGW